MNGKIVERIITKPFDAADYIGTPEDAREFLQVCIDYEDPGDGSVVRKALGAIARAHKRMNAGLASEAEIHRTTLYRAVAGDGNPSFATVYKLLAALGFRLRVELMSPDVQRKEEP